MKKFSPMRFTAATEEAAIVGALQLAGASLDEADVEILDTGTKGVTVRVKPKTEAPTPLPVAESESQSSEIAPEEDSLETENEAAEIAAEAAQFEDDETFSDSEIEETSELIEAEIDSEFIDSEIEAETSYLDSQTEGEDEYGDASGEEIEMSAPTEQAPVESAPLETIERARKTAQDILNRMNLNAQVSFVSSESRGAVQLVAEGEDIGILIGKQGATLQSFQYILNLTLNNGAHESEGVRVTVDAGNYRARRQSSLEQTARMAAQRARASGRPVRLEPMPAAERRIIHLYLQTERGITTQSEGREPGRRLVVTPDENASAGAGQGRFETRAPRSGGAGTGLGRAGSERGGRGRGFRR